MESTGKVCSCCSEFKSIRDFYRQGNRHESLCKDCKKGSRGKRDKTTKTNEVVVPAKVSRELLESQRSLTYDREVMPTFDESIFYPEEATRALGFSDEDMDCIVACFRWLLEQREKKLKKEENV